MKKVLIVAADGLSKSGVPNVFMSIIKNLSPEGYVFDVAYFDTNHTYYANEIESFGGKAIYVKTNYGKKGKIKKLLDKMKLKNRIKKILKENGPYDVVHSFKGFESGYILQAAKELKIEKRFSHLCFRYSESSNPLIRMIEKKEITKTKKYSTHAIFDSIGNMNNNLPGFEKNVLIRNCYNEDELFFSPLLSKEDSIKLVQVGSYSSNKNQKFTLELFERLLKEKPLSQLHFIGFPNADDPTYYDDLLKMIEKKHLGSSVFTHSFDAKLRDIFAQCNYCIFPSVIESFGIVPIEAQSVGLRCFCSDSIPQENNVGGCVYLPLSNLDLWVSSILEDYKKTLGEHSKFDLTAFSKKEIMQQYLNLYKGE